MHIAEKENTFAFNLRPIIFCGRSWWDVLCWTGGGEQKCFTTWERKCRYSNKPQCVTQTKEFCDTHKVKECRYIKKPEYIVSSRILHPILEKIWK